MVEWEGPGDINTLVEGREEFQTLELDRRDLL
jgi:hypothetical protein